MRPKEEYEVMTGKRKKYMKSIRLEPEVWDCIDKTMHEDPSIINQTQAIHYLIKQGFKHKKECLSKEVLLN